MGAVVAWQFSYTKRYGWLLALVVHMFVIIFVCLLTLTKDVEAESSDINHKTSMYNPLDYLSPDEKGYIGKVYNAFYKNGISLTKRGLFKAKTQKKNVPWHMHRQRSVCSKTHDGQERFSCPNFDERSVCIQDHHICNGHKDCPSEEDENPSICLFYSVINSHLRVLIEMVTSKH